MHTGAPPGMELQHSSINVVVWKLQSELSPSAQARASIDLVDLTYREGKSGGEGRVLPTCCRELSGECQPAFRSRQHGQSGYSRDPVLIYSKKQEI